MFEALRHLSFELAAGVLALTLIGAGLALLAAPQSWLISAIPVVGGFVASIRTSAATVLIAAGVGAGAFVAGYAHRGTLDKSESLRAEIAAQAAVIAEKDRQASAARTIAEAASARADAAEKASADRQTEIDQYAEQLAKRPADSRCGLSDDDVRWLRTKPGGRRTNPPQPPPRSFWLR